ncbi:MAG: tetratricopeptide repeat protein [bacterium]
MKILIFLVFLAGCVTNQYISSYSYKENQKAVNLYERGLEFKEKGEYANAINEFQRFLDYYGNTYFCDEAYYQIAECYRLLSQWPEAIKSYKRLISQFSKPFVLLRPFVKERESPFIPEANYKIGLCFEEQRDYLEAIKWYEKTIENYYFTEWGFLSEEGIKRIIAKNPGAKWAKKEEKKLLRLIKKAKKK